ncbi:MAG: peptide chain release factor 2 [Nitrospinae bacterium]|nr:peptide chain release factor 2 [Nitrospinota bacterium]
MKRTSEEMGRIFEGLEARLKRLRVFFDLEGKQRQIAVLEERVSDPGIWGDPDAARKALKEKAKLAAVVGDFQQISAGITGARELFEITRAEGDEGMLAEVDAELDSLVATMSSLELKLVLSGDYDAGNAILTVHAGAGGTESQDWAQMLLRMYLRFAEKAGFKATVIDAQEGEEAGIKSATVEITGDYAYGYLKAESGVHRLVRISPFDSNKRRHTSFSSVFVLPEIDDSVKVDINPADLRVDTFRASGAGGQHVNKTDSAIRITHVPTGVVVQCQNERSQHKNRDMAMKVLRAKLHEMEMRKKQDKIDNLQSGMKDISWGNQIRSYVLHPYRMVKDLRTRAETSNTDGVLDGDIMPFIEAFLTMPAEKRVLVPQSEQDE